MKRLVLSVIMVLSLVGAYAQTQTKDGGWKEGKSKKSRKTRVIAPFYIGVSAGVNNPAGIVGVNLNYHVVPHVVLGMGGGAGTWGDKVYFDAKYMLNPYKATWAFGAGITHSLGENNYTVSLPEDNSSGNTSSVTVDLKPMTNVFLAVYKYWNLGRRANKCFLELGYSVPLSPVTYDQLYGDPITSDGDKVLKFLSPGGVMVGFGMSFGLGVPKERR